MKKLQLTDGLEDNDDSWGDDDDSGWDSKVDYLDKKAVYDQIKEKPLERLDENERGKAKASKKAAELVYIEHVLFKVRTIQY
ncbi:hypothetical protein RCL_jg17966.t1 [Rhizophagus clarus]|uniref:Uncharacterized protein n=1 Tax=Rhizophagus clarus TaxID=94130 RepID=A0A8H3QHH7_9GLOM|nr:hypothetical protein RCL_jg17966.t1 [Rhizophagus clarus]